MRNIYFKSAHILSLRDHKGFSFKFSPNINIIKGENDTGKSSFIKSLYHTLGADVRLDKSGNKITLFQRLLLVLTIVTMHLFVTKNVFPFSMSQKDKTST
ncbi:AAA family ATPase [Vibrio owensii]|uniref:AAA family ATPase n=1 Tax=Vibrio owensii TaxID=696485 RepID=UPI004068A330